MAVTYVRAGGPPDNWAHLRIFDIDNRQWVVGASAANSEEGWIELPMVRLGEPVIGLDGNVIVERRRGHFEIIPPRATFQ